MKVTWTQYRGYHICVFALHHQYKTVLRNISKIQLYIHWHLRN